MALANLLIVDDSPENIALLCDLLRPDYHVRVANSGERALELAQITPLPDLVLLDVVMPGVDGYAVLEKLKRDPVTSHIPVIFTTVLDSEEDLVKGLHLGAVDYITKPIVPQVLLARLETQLELKRARDRLADQNSWLESEVSRRMKENDRIQQVSIRALAHLAEIRDPETGRHILRTQGYVKELATLLKDHPRFSDTIDDTFIELITRSAPLHDIGKVGIPDHILLKPGALTADERLTMQTHATLGAQAIELADEDSALGLDFLSMAREIAHWHHERWDGKGYPDGLKAEQIPVSARLMSVADVFDALISPRPYKHAMRFDEANALITKGVGTQFDPIIAGTFLEHYDMFKSIALRFSERLAETEDAAP